MRTVGSIGLGVIWVSAALGCSGAQGRRADVANGAPGAHRAARTFTDSDVVTGFGVTRSDAFASTLRGVLRFSPDASGTPSRMTTAQGLPDDHVFALSVSPDGITWAATARGVARLMGDRWMTVGGAQPDVGRPTALLALGSGQVLLGGAQGLARFDGSRWLILTNRYQVMALAAQPGGGVLVAKIGRAHV
jgi:hypothetical protein